MPANSRSRVVLPTPPDPKTYSTLKGGSSAASADLKRSRSAARPTNFRRRSALRRAARSGDIEHILPKVYLLRSDYAAIHGSDQRRYFEAVVRADHCLSYLLG